LKIALKQNPTILSQEAALKAADAGVDVQESALLPVISLSGSVQKNITSFVSDPTSSTRGRAVGGSLQAKLTVPIYEAGVSRSRIRQASLNVGKSKFDLAAAQRAATEAVVAYWSQLKAAENRVKAAEDQVKFATVALEGMTLENEVGTKTTTDVLIAQSKKLAADLALISAKNDLSTTSYKLLSAMGQMTAKNLKLNVDFYDPIAKYAETRDRWF
jgi:outer membrane protein